MKKNNNVMLLMPGAVLCALSTIGSGPLPAQTQCQIDGAIKSPETPNPPSCAAFYKSGEAYAPPYPTPQEVPVYVNPSIWNTDCNAACTIVGTPTVPNFKCCNTLGGFGSGHLSVVEAERLLKSHFLLFHSKSGSLLSYRWGGRTQTETFCGPDYPGAPALNILARNELQGSTGIAHWYEKPGADSLLCANLGFKLREGDFGIGVNWQWGDPSGGSAPQPAGNLTRLIKHEAGHSRGMAHQSCAPAGSPPENDHTATTGECTFNSGTPPSGLIHEPIHMADQRYSRIDYGVPDYGVREISGLGFAPTSWQSAQSRPVIAGHKVVSAISAADSNGKERGFAYNVWKSDTYLSRLAVTLYENGVWKTESGDPGGYATSWSRPDIARASDSASGQSWIVAFVSGASAENSGSRWPNVVEKAAGGSASSWIRSDLKYLVPDATLAVKGNHSGFDSIAVAYDPISKHFILVWIEREDDGQTADTEVIKASTRLASSLGSAWNLPQIIATTKTSDGADVACSRWPDSPRVPGNNCLLAWAHPYSGLILYRKLSIDPNGKIAIPLSDHAYGNLNGPTGYHRPALTVNPLTTNPRFLMAYSDWNSSGNIYVATMNTGSNTWVQSPANMYTLPAASRYKWFGPPGLGTYMPFSDLAQVFTHLLVAF